jgi:hypothetical protein
MDLAGAWWLIVITGDRNSDLGSLRSGTNSRSVEYRDNHVKKKKKIQNNLDDIGGSLISLFLHTWWNLRYKKKT